MKIQQQWYVIKMLAKLFDDHEISYCFFQSTSVFANGVEFDMEDIDILLPYSKMEQVKKLLGNYFQSDVKYNAKQEMYSFYVYIDFEEVHCKFTKNESILEQNVEFIEKDGQKIRVQELEQYLNKVPRDNFLLPHIHALLKNRRKR